MWKQRIISSLWWLIGLGICGLLTAGVQHKKQALCSGIKINIEGAQGHVFMDEKEIAKLMRKNGAAANKPVMDIPLQALEKVLRQQPWISSAELFFDNRQVLQATIGEREPLARIFTVAGASFYIDSNGRQLPLSNDYAARVPMFTGFTSGRKKLSVPDSMLLGDIKKMASLIQQDSFWNMQVAQVNITPRSTFEIIPVIGNQTILIGHADSLQSKFDRLFAFYKQVWATKGFEKYATVSAEYGGQVVAVKRGASKPVVDTAQAVRLISAMRNGTDTINGAEKAAQNNALQPSTERVDSLTKPLAAAGILKKNEKGKQQFNKPRSFLKTAAAQTKKISIRKKKSH